MTDGVIINVGCGQGVIEGAVNIDNSISVLLARHMLLSKFLKRIHLINDEMMEYIQFCRNNNIKKGNCVKLPFSDSSVDVVYASHLCEMLYSDELERFINEAYRILKVNGIFRVSTGDLGVRLKRYNEDGDAEQFMNSFALRHEKNKPGFAKRFRYLIFGERKPKWMYDGKSMIERVERTNAGFKGYIKDAGETSIPSALAKNMNLYERADESVYIEFIKK